MRHGTTLALAAAITLALASAIGASAATISIPNASFEDPLLADEAFAGPDGPISGWSFSTTGTVSADDYDWGVWNPPAAAFDGPPPDGDNVTLVFYAGDVGVGEMVLAHATASPLQAALRYELTVQVGDLSSAFAAVYDGFPGARAELRAGGALLASGGPDLAIEGLFSPITVAYVAPPDLAQLGEPIEVRLVATNESPGGGLAWDSVSLTTTEVEAYEFTLADGEGSVSGLLSFVPSASVSLAIPAAATMQITNASGDLAPFASIDWTNGSLTAYESGGRHYLSVFASGNEDGIELAFDAAFDLSGALPLGGFSPDASAAYLLEAEAFHGGDPGADVALTRVPEPDATQLALAAVLALAVRARRRAA
ncbi:MAG: hypothetical protein DCC71_20725 [Proteobacteria bacterium]|nr:MAG: hypothetical protein DCC71_20725 [Pseudomonadota bacterium]